MDHAVEKQEKRPQTAEGMLGVDLGALAAIQHRQTDVPLPKIADENFRVYVLRVAIRIIKLHHHTSVLIRGAMTHEMHDVPVLVFKCRG